MAATDAPATGSSRPVSDPAPRLAEVDALRIAHVIAERAALVERHGRLRLELQMIEMQHAAMADGLNRLVERAAADAGLDLAEGWQPDLKTRTWEKERAEAKP